ncbi:MAG: chorismate synthase [Anaerovoracaceae bacterium]|jgi:chorismate synthase
MSDNWGRRIKLSIFGESHGPAVGITIDGLPPGIPIDHEYIIWEMARRAPGKNRLSTARKEADSVEILSGVYKGKTTGTSICGIIRNLDTKSDDYDPVLRPGHADLTALFKYKGHGDMRGGGHFSGRLTAPLVFAGAFAKLVLKGLGISIHGRIYSIGTIKDDSIPLPENWVEIGKRDLPVSNMEVGHLMEQCILDAKSKGDSVGGIIEVYATGLPAGLGDPFFSSIESVSSSLFFSIPAVKGVEFGRGFALSEMMGSVANDDIVLKEGSPTTLTNNCGGILGGISTGEPIIARLAFKPTPSIALTQNSVDLRGMKEIQLNIKGRHDPCIVPRAVPVAEAALALAILDCVPEGVIP